MCVKKLNIKEDFKLTRYHEKPLGQKHEGKDQRKKKVYAKPRGAGHMHCLLMYNKKRTTKNAHEKGTKNKVHQAPEKYASSPGEKRKKENKYFQASGR
jgi:hypothetical protein